MIPAGLIDRTCVLTRAFNLQPHQVSACGKLVYVNALRLMRLALVALLLAIFPASGQAGTFVAYGPVTYVRSTGAPSPVTASFTVLNVNTTYTIRIDNSGVSSAVVKLNGVEVIRPNDFNSNVRVITKPVTLLLNNQLSVELRGAPGGSFILQIIGVDNDPPTITGAITPTPNAAGWNNSNPVVNFTCADSTSGLSFCSGPVTVPTETAGQAVVGTAIDKAGNFATASVTVKLDKTPPSITVTSPASGSRLFTSQVVIGGMVADTLSGLASLNCNGTPATVNGESFSCSLALTQGTNTINVIATDVAGNSSTSALSLIFARVPTITITSPSNLSYLNISPTTVTGTVDDPTATVTVNSVQAAVGNGSFSVALPLAEGPNTITASATSPAGAVGTTSIEVTLDTTPPHVTITSPPDRFATTDASISVAGSVNDIVVGTVNAQQAQVTVNGAAAQVANRTFLATNVPLEIGTNVIQAVGRDRVGNAATTQITVTRQAPTQSQIRLISGNNQTGAIGSVLAAPLVIAVTDQGGNPIPNRSVIFKVTQNDGMISAGGQPAPTLVVTTNAQGQAQAQWKLGMRAGAGGNVLEAYSVGFEGTAIFTATGTQGPAGKIVIDTGNDQIGVANQRLPKPLIAIVVDNGNNRLAGLPVTFTVKQGGGSFGGQPTFTVNTDSDGRVAATLTLGPQEGNANNLVEANFPSNTGFAASFTASGRTAGDPSNTTISGVVLDNSNVPIPGVTIRAVLTNQLNSNRSIVQAVAAVQTNAQGQFSIAQAPVGLVKLMVDGSTAQRPGTYPTLDYDLITVAGQANTLSQPIYLLALNTNNQLCVTPTTGGGTLTIPEAPGFSLTFGPGQVTFPGGSRTGCVSVTVVHGDKVPMVPGFGQQPRFIVTIQPAGAVFNPPAQITLPNVDGLKPREVTEMYSFDHDIGSFVAIGTGTVSDDGKVIRSNPGVGVLKAGWHCGGNPSVSGTAANCPACKLCQGNACVADPGQEMAACDDKDHATVDDKCMQGTCAGTRISLEFREIWSDQFSGIKANFLPGGAAARGNSGKYILMGARSDQKGHFRGTLQVTPDTEEARSRVKVAVMKNGAIEDQGSLSGSIASGSASSTFGQVTDFQLVAGIDKNQNGSLDLDEISARHQTVGLFRLVPESVYEFNRAAAVGGTILPGLPFLLPRATLLLFCFGTGRVPVDATVTFEDVLTSNPSLSHAVGALWGNDRRAQIPKFEFGPTSSWADDVVASTAFQSSLRSTFAEHINEVRTFFNNPANSSVTRQVFGPWNVRGTSGANISFSGDLFLAIGTATISGQVRVEVTRQGSSLVVTAIDAANVTISDLYDWDYDNGFDIDRRAATVQAGYNTLGDGGRIFYTSIVINGQLTTIPTFSF